MIAKQDIYVPLEERQSLVCLLQKFGFKVKKPQNRGNERTDIILWKITKRRTLW